MKTSALETGDFVQPPPGAFPSSVRFPALHSQTLALWNFTGPYAKSVGAIRSVFVMMPLLNRSIDLRRDEWKMRPIGYIRCAYTDTQQIPKGLGATHTMEGTLEVLPEFEQGLQDIEGFSHLFILWVFHKSLDYELIGKAPTDDRPHGVFSTRSPRRPNPIGLTVVELMRREGPVLHLRGIDMLDGTPVLDIKPYLSSISMDKLRRGWLEEAEKRQRFRLEAP